MIGIPAILDPVIRYDGTNTTLTNAVKDYSPDQWQGEEVESVIDGTAGVIYKGRRFVGEITMFNVSLATYTALKAMELETVRLWMFGQGGIPDTAPAKYYPYVDVLVISVQPFHKDNQYYHDACIVRFKSVAYYELALADDTGISET